MKLPRRSIVFCIAAIIPFLFLYPLFAYNYMRTNHAGQPLKWDNSKPIQYYLDPDPILGYTLEQTLMMLQEAMRLWEDVPTANIKFEFAGYLPEDVNESNYSKYLDKFTCYTESLEYCKNLAVHESLQTVIIIDGNNGILDNYMCLIAPCTGIAGPMTFEGGILDNIQYILQGYVVLGKDVSLGGPASHISVMAHELGHLLNLGHLVVNQQLRYSTADIENPTFYLPTMFGNPTSSFKSCGTSEGTTLNPDDIAGISYLYPSDTFAQEIATIKGTIKKSNGGPMDKVNVIVRNKEDPLCKVYSFISGKFCPHWGGQGWLCDEPDGQYTISGLPPGDYTVEVEEVEDEDIAMGVGLYYGYQLAGDAEFWNEGDQADEDPYTYTVISLAAGEIRENVDIILNRSEVTEDRVKFIPLDVIIANFPLPETTACTDTTIDYAELIGYEEPGSTTTSTGGCSLILRK